VEYRENDQIVSSRISGGRIYKNKWRTTMLSADEERLVKSLANVLTTSSDTGLSIPEDWQAQHRMGSGLRYPDGAAFQWGAAIVRRGALVLHLRQHHYSHWTGTYWDLYVTTPPDALIAVKKNPKNGDFQLAESRTLHCVTSQEGPWWDDLRKELNGFKAAADDLKKRWEEAAARAEHLLEMLRKREHEALKATYKTGRSNSDAEVQPRSLFSRIRSLFHV
jgi:hypothetical protein